MPGGVRVFAPLPDGTDRVGVLAFTADSWDDHDRRLARRLAGLQADVLVTKGLYTDRFFQARRRQPMSLSAEMQWSLVTRAWIDQWDAYRDRWWRLLGEAQVEEPQRQRPAGLATTEEQILCRSLLTARAPDSLPAP